MSASPTTPPAPPTSARPVDPPPGVPAPPPLSGGQAAGGTVGDMIDLYRRAYAEGRVSRSRTANLHAAAARILGALPDWRAIDARDPMVHEHLQRFTTTGGAGLTRMTVNDYASVFASALREFDTYLTDPGGWRPTFRRRTPTTPPPPPTTPAAGTRHMSVELPGARLAVLRVPADLTGPEAAGLARDLHTRLTNPTTDPAHLLGALDPDQNPEVSP